MGNCAHPHRSHPHARHLHLDDRPALTHRVPKAHPRPLADSGDDADHHAARSAGYGMGGAAPLRLSCAWRLTTHATAACRCSTTSRSPTIFGCSPRESRSVAHEWRKSYNRVLGNPAFARSGLKCQPYHSSVVERRAGPCCEDRSINIELHVVVVITYFGWAGKPARFSTSAPTMK